MKKILKKKKKKKAKWWEKKKKKTKKKGFFHLERALKGFFGKRSGLPRFKRKFLNDNEGILFTTNTRRLEPDCKHFTIPTIGTLKLHERATKLAYLQRHGGRITNVMVKYSRERWHLTITVRVSKDLFTQYHLLRLKKDKKKSVGINLGLKHAAVFSDGTVVENPRSYEKQLRKLRRLNKELARRKKYNKRTGEAPSKRYDKTKHKLRKTYTRVANQEKDYTHISEVVKSLSTIERYRYPIHPNMLSSDIHPKYTEQQGSEWLQKTG